MFYLLQDISCQALTFVKTRAGTFGWRVNIRQFGACRLIHATDGLETA